MCNLDAENVDANVDQRLGLVNVVLKRVLGLRTGSVSARQALTTFELLAWRSFFFRPFYFCFNLC